MLHNFIKGGLCGGDETEDQPRSMCGLEVPFVYRLYGPSELSSTFSCFIKHFVGVFSVPALGEQKCRSRKCPLL